MPKRKDEPFIVNVIRQPDKNVQRAFFMKLTRLLMEDETREKAERQKVEQKNVSKR